MSKDPVKIDAEPAIAAARVEGGGDDRGHSLLVSFKSVAGRCVGCGWSASSFTSVEALQEAHANHLAETFSESEG